MQPRSFDLTIEEPPACLPLPRASLDAARTPFEPVLNDLVSVLGFVSKPRSRRTRRHRTSVRFDPPGRISAEPHGTMECHARWIASEHRSKIHANCQFSLYCRAMTAPGSLVYGQLLRASPSRSRRFIPVGSQSDPIESDGHGGIQAKRQAARRQERLQKVDQRSWRISSIQCSSGRHSASRSATCQGAIEGFASAKPEAVTW